MPATLVISAWNFDPFSLTMESMNMPEGWITYNPDAMPEGWSGYIPAEGHQALIPPGGVGAPGLILDDYLMEVTFEDVDKDGNITPGTDNITINGQIYDLYHIFTNEAARINGHDFTLAAFYMTDSNGNYLRDSDDNYISFTLPMVDNLYKPAFQGEMTLIASNTIDEPKTFIPFDKIICFCRGTEIETDQGPVQIERLAVGNRIVTRDNGIQEIRWMGSIKISTREFENNPDIRPIRIRAGALGNGLPNKDLYVSPQHRILIRSEIARRMFGVFEILVAAKHLLKLNGIEITEDNSEVEYFHILFDRHEVVFANGAETESLYTGPEALKSVDPARRAEILTLFPALHDRDYTPAAARLLASGRLSRKLAMRHIRNDQPLIMI